MPDELLDLAGCDRGTLGPPDPSNTADLQNALNTAGTLRAAVLENTYSAGTPRGGGLNQWTPGVTDLTDFVYQQLAAVYAARPKALSGSWHGALMGHGTGASDVRLWDVGVGSAGGNPSNAYGIVIGSTTVSPPPPSPAVQDGGFEVPPGFHLDPTGTPWTYTGSAGVVPNGNATYTGGNGSAPDGGQVGFLQNNATVSQSIIVSQAGWYTLGFYTAQSAPRSATATRRSRSTSMAPRSGASRPAAPPGRRTRPCWRRGSPASRRGPRPA
jgi:hypothetical protein